MFNTSLRGTLMNGSILGAYEWNVEDAIQDITANGLGKTKMDGGGQRCLLGSIDSACHGVKFETLADIIRMLPPEPGDEALIQSLLDCPTTESAVEMAIDRIAAYNDDDHTTAEDVLLLLKKLEPRR
jgi:hypothetical protein